MASKLLKFQAIDATQRGTRFQFLALPPEIRQSFYACLLQSLTVRQYRNNAVFYDYDEEFEPLELAIVDGYGLAESMRLELMGGSEEHRKLIRSLLFVNRQVSGEALAFFYSNLPLSLYFTSAFSSTPSLQTGVGAPSTARTVDDIVRTFQQHPALARWTRSVAISVTHEAPLDELTAFVDPVSVRAMNKLAIMMKTMTQVQLCEVFMDIWGPAPSHSSVDIMLISQITMYQPLARINAKVIFTVLAESVPFSVRWAAVETFYDIRLKDMVSEYLTCTDASKQINMLAGAIEQEILDWEKRTVDMDQEQTLEKQFRKAVQSGREMGFITSDNEEDEAEDEDEDEIEVEDMEVLRNNEDD